MFAPSPIRILMAEDFPSLRRFFSTILADRPQWQVIYEASDGLEAVQKSEELQPDLVLLDISLPKLDGIEAAARIAVLAPQCKILFLSEESSAEVVRKVLLAGAHGYVLKSQAQTDLPLAVEEVIHDRLFISNGLRLSWMERLVQDREHSHRLSFAGLGTLLRDGDHRPAAGYSGEYDPWKRS